VGDLLSGEVQQIERGKLVIMLNKFREAGSRHSLSRAESPRAFPSGRPAPRCSQARRGDSEGTASHAEPGDPMFVKALFKLEVPEIQQGIVEVRAAAPRSWKSARRSRSSRATTLSIRLAHAWD
jgi:N utilization substance protein A